MFAAGADAASAEDGENCQVLTQEWYGDDNVIATDDEALNELLNDYFSFRENSFTGAEDLDEAVSEKVSEQVFSDEMTRRGMIAERFAAKGNVITDAAVTRLLDDLIDNGDGSLQIFVREWTFYDYQCEGCSETDVSGFGTDHELLVEKNEAGEYVLTEDSYTEEDLFGVVSSSYEEETVSEVLAGSGASSYTDYEYTDSETETKEYETVDSSDDTVVKGTSVNYCYSPRAAAKYADKYAKEYNSDYRSFASVGGDCSNFTSQCLTAGGLPQVSGSSGWYYNNGSDSSDSWRFADILEIWMGNHYGEQVSNASASDIYIGNPVFYNWDGGSVDHAAICVGYDSSGTPLVDAHTNDRYHVEYDLGCDVVSTVQIVNFPDTKAKVTADELNVREGASSSYDSLGVLSEGDIVTLLGESKNWYQIKFNGSTGYISNQYVKIGVGTETVVQSSSSSSSGTYTGTVKTSSTDLNVRSGPSTSYKIIGTLSNGAKVTIISASNGWYKIKYGSQTGYVSGDYVKIMNNVKNLTGTSYNKKIALSWDKVTNADGYYIYAAKYNGSKYVKYKTYATTKVTCNFNDLINGDKYQFKIKPYKLDSDGKRIYGSYCSAITAVPKMDAVSGLEAQAFNKKVRINWDASSGAKGYYIYVLNSDGDLYKTYSTTNTYCNFTDLTNNKAYKFKVRTYYKNSYGSTAYGKYCSYKSATPYNDVVTGLKATGASKKVALSWNSVKNVDGYYIYAMYSDGSKYKTYSTTKTTCNFNNLKAKAAYKFKIRTYKLDQTGKKVYSTYCSTVSAKTTN